MKKIIFIIFLCVFFVIFSLNRNVNETKEEKTKTNKEITEETKEEETKEEKTKEEKLQEMYEDLKESSIQNVEGLERTEEVEYEICKYFEEMYQYMSSIRKFEEATNEDMTGKFLTSIGFFYSKYEEGTVGYSIGEVGFDALKSLICEDGKYMQKMQHLKEIYEENIGKIYTKKYESGKYKVGTDIEPGEFVFFSNSSRGYFCISSDTNGNDIIANDNFEYNSIITLKDGEYLELSRCYAVPISEIEILPLNRAKMFKVGVHLPAGEYKLISDSDSSYYCIYSDSRQDEIEANNNFSGQSYVTVREGQYLQLSRCHIE